MRVMAPTANCREVDAPSGKRYRTSGGVVNMSDRDAKAMIAAGGWVPSMAGTTRAGIGYRCTVCGFGCWFKKCSRCGGVAVREVVH